MPTSGQIAGLFVGWARRGATSLCCFVYIFVEPYHTLHTVFAQLPQSETLDGVTVAREYRDAALLVMTWTNPGRPLATATNNGVWKAMLSPNVRFSHLPQPRSLHVLHLLIRFYISIEDGECMVERDLGELKGFNDAHCNVNAALADDLMILRADPVEARDISPDFTSPDGAILANSSLQVPVASCSGLGSKSRRWATLWREVYGARLGCFRKVAPSEHSQRRPGSFVAAKYGVLARRR